MIFNSARSNFASIGIYFTHGVLLVKRLSEKHRGRRKRPPHSSDGPVFQLQAFDSGEFAVLLVASVSPRLSAVPAISRSSGPIPIPRRSSSRRIRAASLAAARSKGTSSRPPSMRDRILRRCGLAPLSVPYSSSYATMLGIAISEGGAVRNLDAAGSRPLRQ